MSNGDDVSARTGSMARLREIAVRVARSWQIGALLLGVAAIFVALSWRTVDFSGLSHITGRDLVFAGVAYVAAIVAMATATLSGVGEERSRIFGSALTTQILKYVPGTVWQGQPMLATGGGAAVGRFAGAILGAAGLGLVATGRPLGVIVGGCLALALAVVSGRALGVAMTTRLALSAAAIAAGIALSGAFLGPSLGMSRVEAGRDVVAAWGLGVIAVPVPAGLGIRELYFSLVTDTDAAAQLAVTHRALTIGIDVIVGLVGFRLGFRRKT